MPEPLVGPVGAPCPAGFAAVEPAGLDRGSVVVWRHGRSQKPGRPARCSRPSRRSIPRRPTVDRQLGQAAGGRAEHRLGVRRARRTATGGTGRAGGWSAARTATPGSRRACRSWSRRRSRPPAEVLLARAGLAPSGRAAGGSAASASRPAPGVPPGTPGNTVIDAAGLRSPGPDPAAVRVVDQPATPFGASAVWHRRLPGAAVRLLDHARRPAATSGSQPSAPPAKQRAWLEQRAPGDADVVEAHVQDRPRCSGLLGRSDGPSCRSWTTSSSGSELLGPEHGADADGDQRQAERARRAAACSTWKFWLPGRAAATRTAQRAEDDDEPDRRQAASRNSSGDVRSTRFSALVPGDREPLAAVDDVDAVASAAPIVASSRLSRPRCPGRRPAPSDGRGASLMTCPDPQDRDDQHADADEQIDQALGHRADTGRGRRRPGPWSSCSVLDVGDDRRFCSGRELVVAEHRHVLRAGQHRRVDLGVGVLSATARTCRRTARRPCRRSRGRTRSSAGTARRRRRARASSARRLPSAGHLRAAAERLRCRRPSCVGLLLGELRPACSACASCGSRHPAGADLEVRRRPSRRRSGSGRGPPRPAGSRRGR